MQMNWGLNLARIAGVISLLLGALVLLGWYLHEPALIQINPAFVPMQYNTALGFALGGLVLMGLAWHWPRIAVITAAIVFLTGVLTLIEYGFGIDLHIDQLFMEHYIDLQTSNPGRMAPNTALCFSLTGLTGLFTIWFRDSIRISTWTATLGALIISLGVTALAGYMVGVESAYGWGHMTRMAIHTAAGFIVLGVGFVSLAWSRSQQLPSSGNLPHWFAQIIAITGFTITFAMWQAMSAQEQRMVSSLGDGAANFSDEGLLIFGILLTLALAYKAWEAARAGKGSFLGGRDHAPYIVIALGALLATSLFSMLHANFQSSVKQRFESAALNHTEALVHGIEAYLETLYHIRSAFNASSFVDRDEFHTLVSHSLASHPGIMALEWVPKVAAPDREQMEAAAREDLGAEFIFRHDISDSSSMAPDKDIYFPVYYAEPQAKFRQVLGFDLAARPGYLAALNKAARTNQPAVSPRLQLDQSEAGDYSVFVGLPIYAKDMPLESADERMAALSGFAVLVVEIGPMTEAILETSTLPGGLTLTYSDTDAGADKAFMYRHVSRSLDLDPDSGEATVLDDSFESATVLPFADHDWQVTVQAANRTLYPSWNAGSLWLPLGIMSLALGLAYFLHRLKKVDAELNYNRMLMHAVLDYSPAVIYLKDLDGRYLMVNRIWSEVTGISEERTIGATDYEIHPREIAEACVDNDRRVASACSPVNMEETLAQADGSIRTFMSHKFPVADADGNVFAVGGVSSDITEIKQREQQYRILVDTIPGTVYRRQLDEDWTMLFISSEVEFLTGYPPADFLADAKQTFASIIQPDDKRRISEQVEAAVAAHEPYMVEYRILHADGSVRYVYERGQAEYDDEGQAEVLDGTILDVTEIKSLQADLEQARDAADAANQAKSAFLANMSHELRTPMNAILGYSEMLMEEAEDTGQDDFVPDLKKINQAGSHLLSLINDVLDLSKIEAGKIEVFAEDIDINILIDEVSATAMPLMEKNSNKLSIQRGQDLGTAHQDLTKIKQTLFNLLSNAAKFTHAGTITLDVSKTVKQDMDWLILTVSDTGIGIAKDKLDQVFEEFTQADGSTTRDYGGTGLGLAISRRFCQLLGGELSVTSEVGSGSSFTVRVPARLPGTKPQESVKHVPVEQPSKVPETGSGETTGPTILVIDDDPEACDIISRYLTKDGFAVVTASSGEDGLRLAHEVQPVAITLDVMMPEMDGWAVLRALKADPELHRIPVVMLTMVEDRTRGYSLGAVDYLTKPVDRDMLHKVLNRYHCVEGSCRVLLVEDDTETRDVMKRNLEKASWAVVEAGNGKEALDRLGESSETPDLILLDLMMPVMDGFGFLAAMRSRSEWRHIPVIVVTAKDLTGEDHHRLNGMVEEVLEKNACTREDFLEHVRDAVTASNKRSKKTPQ